MYKYNYDGTGLEYYPDPQVVYNIKNGEYIEYLPQTTNAIKVNGNQINGTIELSKKPYDIQTVKVEDGDVILCHINDNIDIESCRVIQEELNKTFPNNPILLVNVHVLKGMTILRNKTNRINEIVDEGFIYRPIEEQYPELFGGRLW